MQDERPPVDGDPIIPEPGSDEGHDPENEPLERFPARSFALAHGLVTASGYTLSGAEYPIY